MAQTVHLTLKVNDTVVKGESSQLAQGRKDTIECVSFESGVQSPRNPSTGAPTGRRQHRPLKIRKLLDKSTVTICKALCENATCEASFAFFRPYTKKDSGADEPFLTVALQGAHISDVQMIVPDTFGAHAGATTPEPYEEVTFVFESITWTWNGGASHSDSWSGADK